MRIKPIAAAIVVALSSIGANAGTIFSGVAVGPSFSNLVVGTIHITGLSDLSGYFTAATDVSFGPSLNLTLDSVSFTSGTVGSLIDSDLSATGFSFHNVAAGDYVVTASGTLANNGQMHNTAFVRANYEVSAVPEPETFAMLLAGLGLMGAIARRRSRASA
jgi:hypothetical protein